MGFIAAAGRSRLFVASCLVAAAVAAPRAYAVPQLSPEQKTAVAALPVPFVANSGQADRRVAYLARTFAGTAFVTTDGRIVYSLHAARKAGDGGRLQGWAITESLATAPLHPVGEQPSPVTVADFTRWTGTPRPTAAAYDRVRLGTIAPGVDASLRATGENLEKLFTVSPGADASAIRVRVGGATALALDAGGNIVVGTGLGDIVFTAPVAFQDDARGRTPVEVRYRVDAAAHAYSFELGAYDRSRPVTIDPLIRSTYSGGSVTDTVRAMLIHPGSGDVYLAGSTTSPAFPTTPPGGPLQGPSDAFIARYSGTLSAFKSVAYYGGGGDENFNALAFMPDTGHIYVAGTTTSSSGLTGITGSYGGNRDGIVVHFDAILTTVFGAAYFGGSGIDNATAIAVDSLAGEVVVAGDTTSTNLALGGAGSAQGTNRGGVDGFVARFAGSNLALIRATYLGGGSDDEARAVAVDPVSQDVVVAGTTQSNNLLKTANGALATPGGGGDSFVARLNAALTSLQQTSYFGGTGNDEINAVAIHPFTGHVYAAGVTTSTDLRGRLVGQTSKGAGSDAFVVRFYPELTGLKAVTYFGDAGDDVATALAISPSTGEVYIAGYTTSTTLPALSGGAQTTNSGLNDAFAARLDANLTTVLQATFAGGAADDFGYAIGLNDAAGLAYIAGQTGGAFPATLTGAQSSPGGGTTDGFAASMFTDLRSATTNPAPLVFTPKINVPPLLVQTSDPTPVIPAANAKAYVDGQPGSSWCASSVADCSTCDLTNNAYTSGVATIVSPIPYYVCVRQIAPAALNAISEATLHIGAVAGTFRVTTGTVPGFGCTLDVDGSGGPPGALTDGLLLLRAMLGMTGTAVTNGTLAAGASRTSWTDIRNYLNTTCGTNFQP